MKVKLINCLAILTFIAPGLALAGVENTCADGSQHIAEMGMAVTQIDDLVTNKVSLETGCKAIKKADFVEDARDFARNTAYGQLYYSNTFCAEGHHENRCSYFYPGIPYYPGHPGYPNHPGNPGGGYYACHSEFVCTRYQTIEKKYPGFEEAVMAFNELKMADDEIDAACKDAKKKDMNASSSTMLMSAKGRISAAAAGNFKTFLNKTGCAL